MIGNLPNIQDALRQEILAGNPRHREDQELVLSFIRLIGKPNRPIDEHIQLRSPEEFARVRTRLPEAFFEPFNDLLRLVGMATVEVAPSDGSIGSWNTRDFVPALLAEVERRLDDGTSPTLVPVLVSLFLNLEWERVPVGEEWEMLTAIAV